MSHSRARKLRRRALAFAVAVVLLGGHNPLAAAELKIFADGPLKPALEKLTKSQRDNDTTVQFEFGLSPVIHKRVMADEPGDMLIIQPSFIEELVKAGKAVGGDHPIIGRVGIGLVARAGTKPVDLSTADALKRTLLEADTIVFNNVASGNSFAEVLERLGIGEAVKSKVVRTTPAEVDARILNGKGRDIGVGTIPLILLAKGLVLLGALPAEFQRPIPYAAALMTAGKQPVAAKKFIAFMATPKAKSDLNSAGVN